MAIRIQASTRMVIACMVIVTLSMTLDIPNAALSAYLVFFVSREDMVTTAVTGIVLVAAVSVAIALTLLCDLLTFDDPALRVALMAILFCTGMYLSRVLAAGPIGFGLGFVLLLTQSTIDLYQTPEALVRDTLWTWVAFAFAIGVVVVVNLALFPVRPIVLLRAQALRCLAFAGASLAARRDGAPPPSPIAGVDRLAILLRLARMGPGLRARMPHVDAATRALSSLVEAAVMLGTLPAARTNAARSDLLNDACLRIGAALATDEPIGPVLPVLLSPAHDARDAALLDEILFHLRAIGAAWQPGALPATRATPARRLFVTDALTNPAHLQFALKTTFAAMLCYIVYTAVAWPGIHTCIITCAVIALTSQGATIHKAALRLAGAVVGGMLALLVTVFVVPHLDSIGGLLLTIAPVAALCAWIAAGSERTAYFGWQIAFAFFLCVLHGAGPSTDVTLVRDRLVGILLGIVVMAWVFRHVWPESADARMRTLLARALHAVGAMTMAPTASLEAYLEQRGEILVLLAEAERNATVAAFEPRAPGGCAMLAVARGIIIAGLHATQPRSV